MVQRSNRAVVFTGAGISTECGIPDFRSPGGFWTRYKPIPFDEFLASDELLQCPHEGIFQGPIADALTHVGQIAMLRRMSGEPIRGENYFVAGIEAGRVGPDQAEPRREFD